MNTPEHDSEKFQQALLAVRTVGLRAQAHYHGNEWVQSQLADRKIDRWLAMEHGEEALSAQLDDILADIHVLESVQQPSIFDPPSDDPSLLNQVASAELVTKVLYTCRAQQLHSEVGAVLLSAKRFLETDEGRSMAVAIMETTLEPAKIIYDHIDDVIARAKHLLSVLR